MPSVDVRDVAHLGREKLSQDSRVRKRALAHILELVHRGEHNRVIPYLIGRMVEEPAVAGIHLWQVDACLFGTSRYRALQTIREARTITGDTMGTPDGYVTLAWALASQRDSQRMVAWLWCMIVREKRAALVLPDGFPYQQLYTVEE